MAKKNFCFKSNYWKLCVCLSVALSVLGLLGGVFSPATAEDPPTSCLKWGSQANADSRSYMKLDVSGNALIDTGHSSDTRSLGYRPPTNGAYRTDCAWYMDFYSGGDYNSAKSSSYYVRAARVKKENKWETITVDSEGMAGRCLAIALDRNNNPGILHSTQDSPYLIKFAKKDIGDNWTSETVTTINSPTAPKVPPVWLLILNSFPRAIFDNYPSNHGYSEWNGSSWQTQTFSTPSANGDIKVDGSDFSHIVWYTNANLEYCLWNGSTWQKETVDSNGDVGYGASLILDGQGRKYISYAEWASKLKFAFHDGSSWSVEYLDTSTGDTNSPHPIGLDSRNRPVILYFDNDGVSPVKLASKVDGQWQFESTPLTTSFYPGREIGFVVDASDRVHISCYQKESDQADVCYLKYFLYDGVNWSGQIVDQFTNPDKDFVYSSLAVSPDGTVHIAYADPVNHDLKYATNVQLSYSLTKSVSPSSGGAISASPDKSAYTEGESVTLSANPDACYSFTGWSGECSGTSPTCTLTMNADKSVTANFDVNKYSVSVTADKGTVAKSPNLLILRLRHNGAAHRRSV